MADVNVQKRPSQSSQESQGLSRRNDPFGLRGSAPSYYRNPFEFLSPFGLMRRFGDDFEQFFGNDRDGGQFWPAIDVCENNGKLTVRADLPGIDKNDVKVELHDNNLVISGERKRESEEDSGGIRRRERSYGSFYRSIPLPEGVKPEDVRANFNDGVLQVSAPIPENQRRRSIPIEGASPASSAGERKQMNSEAPQSQRQTRAG